MGKITQTKKIAYRKSQTTTDSKGRKHCGYCGAYIGNKGKK